MDPLKIYVKSILNNLFKIDGCITEYFRKRELLQHYKSFPCQEYIVLGNFLHRKKFIIIMIYEQKKFVILRFACPDVKSIERKISKSNAVNPET